MVKKITDSSGKAFFGAKKLKKQINTTHNDQKDHKCDSGEEKRKKVTSRSTQKTRA